MRTVRLAQLIEYKYLKSEAASADQKINDVKQELIDAYNNYVNIDKVKPAYNILPLLAEKNEPYSKQIIALFEDLINAIDTLDLHDLFSKVQNVLAVIGGLQDDKNKVVRNSIHDIWQARRETEINQREMAKSKFENVVFKKLGSILKKAGERLSRMIAINTPLLGGPTEPQVKEPSKQEMYMFRFTPTARAYHLDNPDVFGKVWSYPDLRRQITYLINSAKKRKSDFFNDPVVKQETTAIMEAFKRMQTNESFFEAPEEVAQQQLQTPSPEEAAEEKKEASSRLEQILKRYQ